MKNFFRNRVAAITLLLVVTVTVCYSQTTGYKPFSKINSLLWYKDSAADWNEALPIGNGFMGAMVFGNVQKEHLQLNENTLYSVNHPLFTKR